MMNDDIIPLQYVVERKEMQPEILNTERCCRLCLQVTTYTNSKVIEKDALKTFEVILPSLNLEDGQKHFICDACNSKLFAAFNFKSACMDTEDIISPHVSTDKISVIELKDIYLKINRNILITDMSENQKICRLCLQLITCGFVSLNEVDNGIIDTYVPQVNIYATRDPVICRPCYNSLSTHGGFLKNCRKALEEYKGANKQPYIKSEEIEIKVEVCRNVQPEQYKGADKQPYIKTEDIEIKMEECYDAQLEYENIDKPSYVTSEEIEIKTEHGIQDNDFSSHDLDGETTENNKHISEDKEETDEEYMLECESKVQINKCETLLNDSPYENRYQKIRMYKCDACAYETKSKVLLKRHQLRHKDPSEVQIYKCDACDYESKVKCDLKRHQLTHKDPSEIQMNKCDNCNFESKYKSCLKIHQLTHKNPSDIQMYKCDVCDFGSKRKDVLKSHQLLHKDPSEVQMYKCNKCTYECKYKRLLNSHQLTHKDPSEIQKYKCDACNYECKRKSILKRHQLVHKYPSEIQMYKCNSCNFESKYKNCLKGHQLTHKDPSEIQMYKCDACDYVAKRKGTLKIHQLTHEDPSEVQMYKCNLCGYETKYRYCLQTHEARHKNSLQI